MFLVYTALASPSSDIAIPVVKCVEALQKNIRRMILRKRFTKSVVASKKIQTAFRRHSAVSKWQKRLADVPERTVGALFSSLAEARVKVSVDDHYVASLQSALQTTMTAICDKPYYIPYFDADTKALVFWGECYFPAAFKSMKDAVTFFESLKFKNGWPHRAVLIDPCTPSSIHGKRHSWTELRFRGRDFRCDDNFRSFMQDRY